MANLPTPSSAPTPVAPRPTLAATGALLGAVIWLEIVAIGVPMILAGRPGYGAIPVAAIAGALLGQTPARRLLWAVAISLGAVIGVVAYTPLVRWPAHALIRSDPLAGDSVHAVLVLSGGVSDDGHLEQAALDRLLTGASLVRRGVSETIILSRVRAGRGAHQVTSDADQQRILGLLSGPARVLVVDSVRSTRDEAVRMAALARALGITRAAVVTSPLHTGRACATFEKVGLHVACVPSDSRDVALGSLRSAADRIAALRLTLYEGAARVLYRARGWI